MSSFKNLGKDIIAYGLMHGVSKSVNLILLPILTRQFTTDEYGVIDIIVTLTSLLTLFITLSLESAVMRFWNESKKVNKQNELFSGTLLFVFGIGILVLFICFFFSESLSNLLLEDKGSWHFILLGVFAAFFMAANSIPLATLRMRRKILSYNVVNLTQSLLYVGLALILIFKLDFNLTGVFLALVISHIVAFTVGLFQNKTYLTRHITWSYLKPSLKYSVPMFPAVFVTWLNNQADRFLLLYFIGLGAVGVFGASAKIAAIIALLVTIFRRAWSPIAIDTLEKDEHKRNEFYRKALNYYMIGMFLIGLIIVFLSKPLLNLLVPEEYHYGYVIIPWIIGAQILHGAASMTNLGTVISKKTIGNSIAAWIGAIVNITLGFILIPIYGIAGAAIGSFVAEFIFMAVLWFISVRLTSVRYNRMVIFTVLVVYILLSIFYLKL